MSKRKEWACSHGCDLSKVACEHLEALLPGLGAGSQPNIISEVEAENTTMSIFQVNFPPTSSKVMLERVKCYGILDEWDLALLEAKYSRNLSSYDIAKELGYVSPETVQRRLRRIRALLVERGYAQELE